MNGKNRCRILKDIRKRIAEENGIEYITTECKYKGDCLGTCPKCESEVRFLERELQKKHSLGQRIAVAGIAAGITLAATGCTPELLSELGRGSKSVDGDVAIDEGLVESNVGGSKSDDGKVSDIIDGEIVEVVGEMPYTSDTMGEEPELKGEPSYEESATAGILVPEPPEISDPYGDIMGDFVTFDVDINDVAAMNNNEAKQAFEGWTREHIDYQWQEYIDARDYCRTVFVLQGESRIEVWYDDEGNVTDVYVLVEEEPELMGDVPIEEIMGDMEPVGEDE